MYIPTQQAAAATLIYIYSAREVLGHRQLGKILVIRNLTGYMLDIFRFCFHSFGTIYIL